MYAKQQKYFESQLERFETLDKLSQNLKKQKYRDGTITSYRCRADQFLRFYNASKPADVPEPKVLKYFQRLMNQYRRHQITRAAFLQNRTAVAQLYSSLVGDSRYLEMLRRRRFRVTRQG